MQWTSALPFGGSFSMDCLYHSFQNLRAQKPLTLCPAGSNSCSITFFLIYYYLDLTWFPWSRRGRRVKFWWLHLCLWFGSVHPVLVAINGCLQKFLVLWAFFKTFGRSPLPSFHLIRVPQPWVKLCTDTFHLHIITQNYMNGSKRDPDFLCQLLDGHSTIWSIWLTVSLAQPFLHFCRLKVSYCGSSLPEIPVHPEILKITRKRQLSLKNIHCKPFVRLTKSLKLISSTCTLTWC